MAATHTTKSTVSNAPVLYLAFDLGLHDWTLAFTVGLGQPPRLKTIRARNTSALLAQIKAAKKRFGLPDDAVVLCCYEAGRDGFWLHRFLLAHGVQNQVVDSSSIEVNRRQRRAKSDRLDAVKLVQMLIRWHNGERKVWSVLHVPTVEQEDARQLHREMIKLKAEQTAQANSIQGLLAGLGLTVIVNETLPQQLESLRQWDGAKLPPALHQRLLREYQRWQFINSQLRELEAERMAKIRDDQTPQVEKVRRLLGLRGIGENGAWLLVYEFFAWRTIKNRRELGSLAGLTPTPYSSGESRREQGISKAGNRRVRWMMTELAWSWLRYQPQSELSLWYERRFGRGNKRLRKVGIMALARKLLIALWKYLEKGEVPSKAAVIGWDNKRKFKAAKRRKKTNTTQTGRKKTA
jgi:transposase